MCWNFCVSTNFFVSFVVVFGVFRDNDVIDLILLAFIGGAGFGMQCLGGVCAITRV